MSKRDATKWARQELDNALKVFVGNVVEADLKRTIIRLVAVNSYLIGIIDGGMSAVADMKGEEE